MFFRVFFLCGFSSAQVTLRKIEIENFFYFAIEGNIYVFQTFRNVLVYGAFAYVESFCGIPYGCFCVYDVFRLGKCPCILSFMIRFPYLVIYAIYYYVSKGAYMTKSESFRRFIHC